MIPEEKAAQADVFRQNAEAALVKANSAIISFLENISNLQSLDDDGDISGVFLVGLNAHQNSNVTFDPEIEWELFPRGRYGGDNVRGKRPVDVVQEAVRRMNWAGSQRKALRAPSSE